MDEWMEGSLSFPALSCLSLLFISIASSSTFLLFSCIPHYLFYRLSSSIACSLRASEAHNYLLFTYHFFRLQPGVSTIEDKDWKDFCIIYLFVLPFSLFPVCILFQTQRLNQSQIVPNW